MILVGLTGGIATGKSTCSRRYQEIHHIPVIDCDAIVRLLQRPNTRCMRSIQRRWPEAVDPTTGELRREVLSEIVFRDPQQRRALGRIMDFRVFRAILGQMLSHWYKSRRGDVVILDAPLLFESKRLVPFVGCTVVIAADQEVVISRMASRNQLTEQQARQRLAAQLPNATKCQMADVVIWNDATFDVLTKKVDESVAWMRSRRRMSIWRVAITAVQWACLSVVEFLSVF